MSETIEGYVFGHAEPELARLSAQARLLVPFTRRAFTMAGIGPGARVIDLGCGAGDVSLLLAEMVGPSGRVLALDNAPEALAATRAKAERAGHAQIEVARGDLGDPRSLDLPQGFDAAVGRLVLHYVAERAALVARAAAALRPGGALAFVEYDMSASRSLATSPLSERMGRWIVETVRRGGFEPDTGSMLFGLFAQAGLRAELASETVVGGGAESSVAVMLVDVVSSLLPRIVAAGVATEAEVGIETLAERLRAEPGADTRSYYSPRLTAAWARTPAA